MQSKLDQLRTFTTVADCGSLNQAAKQLNRTPSAISMSLKQFTEQLGGELFETDRKSTLTPLGNFVLDQSRRVLKDFDEYMESIQRFAKGQSGTVRIACVPSFSSRILPGIVKTYRRAMPAVRLEIRDIDSELINEAVRKGLVDLGIASRHSESPQLSATLLIEEPLGVVCHADHRIAGHCTAVRWAQLDTQDFISSELHKLIDHPRLAQLIRSSKLHIHNLTSLLSFIVEGFGITLLPKSAVPDHLDLSFLPLADESATRRLFLLEHAAHRQPPAVQGFKAHLLAHTSRS